MHIPDGYLSPSTCAAMYATALPFWCVALKRAKRMLNTRTVPLLGLFASFCFVIMMFNLPLPGGTTGHAVGMGMASIVLGPWVSMLAISVALLIQALFFGDGGITAFGANCFNMAIVGSLVAYGVYRLIALRAEITATRRVVAAAIAGYSAINFAALCAAIEFGIQPLLFHTATGTPLYAPYPLSISIPAMMIGHLTFAGLAELVISAGVVSYLQRADPGMLRLTAPDAPLSGPAGVSDSRQARPALRKLSLVLALALILTPLGILAVGSAWGEWSAKDFSDAAVRQQIAAASGNHVAPAEVPMGLKRLSSLWRPPVPAYAPAFIKSPYFGYFVSASTGVGLILLLTIVVSWLFSARLGSRELETPTKASRPRRRTRGFIEKTTESLLRALEETLFAEEAAQTGGLLQSWDARVKLAGIGALIISTVTVHRIWTLAAIFGIAVLLAVFSHISVFLLVRRIWIPALAFTGVIALPAIFLVPGHVLYQVPVLGWSATMPGLRSALFLVGRAETAATLALLLVLSTRWNRLLRALRFFRIPPSVVIILEMTYRYIFLLLRTTQEMIESRRARLVGYLEPKVERSLAAAMVGVLLDKTLQLSNDVHLAMQARGFRGDVRLMEDLRMRRTDWLQLTSVLAVASIAAWIGR
jgi:cobalt/nickel transport system permease protein